MKMKNILELKKYGAQSSDIYWLVVPKSWWPTLAFYRRWPFV